MTYKCYRTYPSTHAQHDSERVLLDTGARRYVKQVRVDVLVGHPFVQVLQDLEDLLLKHPKLLHVRCARALYRQLILPNLLSICLTLKRAAVHVVEKASRQLIAALRKHKVERLKLGDSPALGPRLVSVESIPELRDKARDFLGRDVRSHVRLHFVGLGHFLLSSRK
jgi:hypothetical protein